MSKKELSVDQIRKIDEIKKQWFREMKELPPLNMGSNQLSYASNKLRLDLEKKYMAMIREIVREDTGISV